MIRPSAKQIAEAKAILMADRKARSAERPSRVNHKPARQIRERDPAYLAWLHDLPCIACLILGPAPQEHAHIEAAHQKAQDVSRGWNKRLGVRPSDSQSCPICAWHHRLAPNCCDPAQAKFWSLLGVDVIDFCKDLFSAFSEGRNGAEVVVKYSKLSYIEQVK